MKRSMFVNLALLAGVTLLILGDASWAQAKYPRLHIALFEMRKAREELNDAGHNFGGHKVKAIKGLDKAIKEIEGALRSVGDTVEGRARPKDFKYERNLPHINQALVEIGEARNALREAKARFGEHRVRAIEALDYAEAQLREAVKFARKGKG